MSQVASPEPTSAAVRRPQRFRHAVVDNDQIDRQLARASRWRYIRWPTGESRRLADSAPRVEIRVDSPLLPKILYGGDSPPDILDFWRSATPYLIFSAVLHIACMIWLASLAISRDVDEQIIYLNAVPREANADFVERLPIEIALPSFVLDGDQLVSVDVSPIIVPPDLGGLSPAAQPTAETVVSNSGPVGDVRRVVGDLGNELSAGEGKDRGVEFFGIYATGSRFVFVVDCSRSMSGERWRRATAELLASIERLDDDALFFVVLFDGQTHPMFNSDLPEDELQPANAEGRLKLRDWLDSIRLGEGTKPLKSVRLALDLKPDAIYLLSDGEFADQTAAFLRRNNVIHEPDRLKIPGVVIHTIGFESRDGQAVLERIASENGGRYQFVDP